MPLKKGIQQDERSEDLECAGEAEKEEEYFRKESEAWLTNTR